MAVINLEKGQKIELELSKISVGLGWNPNPGSGSDFDLDASALMINGSNQIPRDEFFVFYGNVNSPDGALHHSGDDPTGGKSETGDDEIITVDLTKVDDSIVEILFVVTIHEAEKRKQNFGQVRRSYIRLVDINSDTEIAKYELDEDYSVDTAIEFGRIYRKENKWKFEASGIGHKADLAFFLSKYYKGEIIK